MSAAPSLSDTPPDLDPGWLDDALAEYETQSGDALDSPVDPERFPPKTSIEFRPDDIGSVGEHAPRVGPDLIGLNSAAVFSAMSLELELMTEDDAWQECPDFERDVYVLSLSYVYVHELYHLMGAQGGQDLGHAHHVAIEFTQWRDLTEMMGEAAGVLSNPGSSWAERCRAAKFAISIHIFSGQRALTYDEKDLQDRANEETSPPNDPLTFSVPGKNVVVDYPPSRGEPYSVEDPFIAQIPLPEDL